MATSMTTATVKEIADLTKSAAHKRLAVELGHDKYDEANIRAAVHTDFVYDNLMFAVEKGFPWDHVCSVAKFSSTLLQDAIGKELTDSLRYIKQNSSELATDLGDRNFTVYMDQLFTTFMHHFKLFQFVFTKERHDMTPKVNLKIETPPEVPNVKDGKTKQVWEYEQKYRKLQEREAERVNQKLSNCAKVMDKVEENKSQKLKDIADMQTPLSKETVESIIKDVIQTYSSSLVEKIKCDIETVTEDLECKLERTSLPRPQALGAPPRFDLKPKTPVATPPKPKTPPQKSPKANRKKSGSSSRSRSRASKS